MKILAFILVLVLIPSAFALPFLEVPTLITKTILGYKPAVTEGEIAAKMKQKCTIDKRKDSLLCYSQEFEKLSYNKGYKFAFSTLNTLQETDKTTTDCHFIAHNIGYGEFRRNPNIMLFSQNSECSYGFSMGIIERYVQNTLKEGIFEEDAINKICMQDAPGQCFHILGHMVISETRGDLNFSIQQCERLKVQYHRYYCETGLFMEMVTPRNLVDHGIVDKTMLDSKARIFEHKAMCDAQSGEKQRSCYGEISAAAIKKFNSTKEIFSFCDSAPAKNSSLECKKHTVTILATDLNLDPKKITFFCDLENDSEYKTACEERLVSTIIALKGTIGADDAKEFCNIRGSKHCLDFIEKKV